MKPINAMFSYHLCGVDLKLYWSGTVPESTIAIPGNQTATRVRQRPTRVQS